MSNSLKKTALDLAAKRLVQGELKDNDVIDALSSTIPGYRKIQQKKKLLKKLIE